MRIPPYSLATLPLAFTSLSLAQDALEPLPSVTELDEIVVTSEKIDRPFSEVLSSVSAIGARQIVRGDITDVNEAFRYSANVTDADFIDSGIVIRGINSEGVGGPSGSPLATLYIDGVPQTRDGARRGALSTWDVSQIEILRGPQSTISGRNSLAGSIRVVTNDPVFATEGAVKFGVGNNGFFDAGIIYNTALNDHWALRLAGSLQHQDGDIDYPTYGGFARLDERQDADSWDYRAKLLYQPKGEDGPTALFSFSQSYDSPMYRDVDGPTAAGVNSFFDRTWGAQSAPVFVEARSTRITQGSMTLRTPVNPDLRLESITGIVNTETNRGSVDLSSSGLIDEIEISQEFRAIYETEKVEAIAGLFFLNSDVSDDRDQNRPWESFTRIARRDSDLQNYALFLDGRYQFSPKWWVLGGLRYDREEQEFNSRNSRVDATGTLSSSANGSDTDYDAFLPKLGLMREFDNDSTLAFVVQRSYRAGGAAFDFVNGVPYDFDPEYAWNYELSYKGSAFDNRLRFAANIFYLDWEDQQINVPQIPGDFNSDLVVNAGASSVYGGELELQYAATPDLTLFSSVGLAKTEFNDFSFVQFGNELSFDGESFPQSPEFTAVLGFEYEHPEGFFCGADAKYIGGAISRSFLEGQPRDELDSYVLVNAHVGYRTGDWTVTAYADNLFDEDYLTYRFNDPGFQVATVGPERTFGVNVRYDF